MSNITDLKERINTKTLNLVLLTIATMGIYPLVWLYTNHKAIDEITKSRTINTTYVVWMMVCAGVGGVIAGTGDEALDLVSGLLTIALAVLYIVWAFKARTAIQEYALNEHKIDLRMNTFYTLVLTIYYVNYCINDLPEAKRKQLVLSGHAATQEG